MVTVDKTEYDSREDESATVEEALREAVAGGKVGSLSVEPDSLRLEAPVVTAGSTGGDGAGGEGEKGFFHSKKFYIIVACLGALLVVAVIQAICTCHKMSKKAAATNKVKKELFFLHSQPVIRETE